MNWLNLLFALFFQTEVPILHPPVCWDTRINVSCNPYSVYFPFISGE